MADRRRSRFQNLAHAPLSAAHRFSSPLVAAFDVACTAARHDHAHEEIAPRPQLVIPRRGVFRWHVGKQTILAEPNTVLLFHPAREHRITHPADGGDDCTSLHLSSEQLDDALQGRASVPQSWLLDKPAQRRVHLAVHTLRAHPDPLAADEAAMQILETLAHTPQTKPDRQTREIEALRERLAANPADRANLQQLARAVHLSPFELARRFKAQTGSSIHQYRLRLRLSLALSRLRDGAEDLTALALDLGFASHAHFTRAFRTAFGTTPQAARRS